MTTIELLADTLVRNPGMIKGHIADFSEADMLVRPTPGANHTAWQLGHLVLSETNMVNMCAPGTIPPCPPDFIEKFGKAKASVDDPGAFAGKDQILAEADRVRTATVAWVKTLSEADLEKPAPEKLRGLAPTIGSLLMMMPVHAAMHLGQIQVIRRKLGRPNIF